LADNLQLQFAGDDGTRYFARVIGYLPGHSLIVSTPKVDGHTLPVSEGKKAGQHHFHHGVELRVVDRAQLILVHAFVYQCIARGEI